MGEKITPSVQLAPALRVVPHVFWETLKGPLALTVRPSAIPPELAIVTACAALVWPITVGANVSVPGFAPKAEADRPVPLSATLADFTPGVDEVTVSVA
jgi:hypothetical protein